MIHVVAVVTAHSGQRDALAAAFRENVPRVLAESGCAQYTLVVDAAGAGGFAVPFGADAVIVLEQWDTPDALAAHGAAPHMKAFAANVKSLVAARAIHVLSEI